MEWGARGAAAAVFVGRPLERGVRARYGRRDEDRGEIGAAVARPGKTGKTCGPGTSARATGSWRARWSGLSAGEVRPRAGKLGQLQRKGSGPRAGSWAGKMKKEATLVEEWVGLGRKIQAGPQGKTAR